MRLYILSDFDEPTECGRRQRLETHQGWQKSSGGVWVGRHRWSALETGSKVGRDKRGHWAKCEGSVLVWRPLLQ